VDTANRIKSPPSARPAIEYTGSDVAKRKLPARIHVVPAPGGSVYTYTCAVASARSSAIHTADSLANAKPHGEGARSWSSSRPGSSVAVVAAVGRLPAAPMRCTPAKSASPYVAYRLPAYTRA
jgi:hypothetical protein